MIETEGGCRGAAEVDGAVCEYAITFGKRGPATRLWDAPGLWLMRVGAAFGVGCGPAVGRKCVRGVAARAVCGGERLEGFRRCVGPANAVEELLDVPASPAAG